ncbi:PQQ-binding-like beta-propeller repeat protein [candidate division WOR-3 bacterium]|nr:PQQ-binding-like beta-propeller repeat protein [candidate division WOR-3 bacterium]
MKNSSPSPIIIFLLCFIASPLSSDEPIPWSTFQFDPQHTGYYPSPLSPPLELKWTFEASYVLTMSSASVGNGMLYLGDPGDRRLVALSVDSGKVIWEQQLTANVWTTALADTLVFAGTSWGGIDLPTFFCLDARTGEIKWDTLFNTVEFSPVPVDTIVYVSDLHGYIYAINFQGEIKWQYKLLDLCIPPAIYNGKVYIGGDDSTMIALDALTGDSIWAFKAKAGIETPPTVAHGIVCFATFGWRDTLYALDAETGELIWKMSKEQIAFSSASPAVYDTFLYIPTDRKFDVDTHELYCVSIFTGSVSWVKEFSGRGMLFSSPLITSNGLVWIGKTDTSESRLCVLDAETGEEIYTYYQPGATGYAWPIVYGDMMFVGFGNTLYALQGTQGVEEETDQRPETKDIRLFQNKPNPFSQKTVISYELPIAGKASLQIYDVTGRLVKTIFEGEKQPGVYNFIWRGKDEQGKVVRSGVYFYHLKTRKVCKTKKVVFVR